LGALERFSKKVAKQYKRLKDCVEQGSKLKKLSLLKNVLPPIARSSLKANVSPPMPNRR
jgi:hypothetical protein